MNPKNNVNIEEARPHPGPFPWEEGAPSPRPAEDRGAGFAVVQGPPCVKFLIRGNLSPEGRVECRAAVPRSDESEMMFSTEQ